jgi:hypothetical protein
MYLFYYNNTRSTHIDREEFVNGEVEPSRIIIISNQRQLKEVGDMRWELGQKRQFTAIFHSLAPLSAS